MLQILNHIYRSTVTSRTYISGASRLVIRQLHAEAQRQRSLVQIKGTEAAPFLQGLITNDINHLEDGGTSMYAMLLNIQGYSTSSMMRSSGFITADKKICSS